MSYLSPTSTFIYTTILVVLATFIWAKFGGYFKKKRYAPIIGTVLNMAINWEKLHDYMTELGHKHKTLRFLDISHSLVYSSDPQNVEYILKTNFNNFGKGKYHYEILTDILGDGIFTVDGEKWRQQRKLASHEFSTKMLKSFSSKAFIENAVTLAQVVSEAANSNKPFEVQDMFMKSTLDSVFKVILGVDLNSMCGTNEEAAHFTNAFDEASELTMLRYVDIFWKIKYFLNIGSERSLRKCVQIVDKFVYKIINRKIAQHRSNSQDSGQMIEHDILSRFLYLNETDPKYLKDIILSFIIAGKDTTAGTLSWFLYLTCKHPLVQEKIAQEVLHATKLETKHPSFADIAAGIDEESFEKMQYLHAALTETLRLHPVIPLEGKACFKDDTLPDGTSVRKGDVVGYTPYVMGRMKRLWGDDAEKFRPERWLSEDNVFQQQSPFKFTAFQAGPRICLGKDFAYRQMKIFAAILLGGFVFKLNDEHKPVSYKTMLTLRVNGGLHLRASHRFGNKMPTST